MESNYCFPPLVYLKGGRISYSIYVICSIVVIRWWAYLATRWGGTAMMPITERQRKSIRAGNTGWISIHINEGDDLRPESPVLVDLKTECEELPELFVRSQEVRPPLPERFPRLTFLAIAVALLISALTAEFDYLRGAGYYWPGK
jgi:hypothetical protein